MEKPGMNESYIYAPYITFRNNKVLDVGYALIDITGYRKSEFMSKSLGEVFDMLRCNISTEGQDIHIKEEEPYYIFTRNCEGRKVYVTIWDSTESDKIMVFTEKPGSRLVDIFEPADRICNENEFPVAIFDISSKVVVKASKLYREEIGEDSIEHFIGICESAPGKKQMEEVIYREKSCLVRNLTVNSTGENKIWDAFVVPLTQNDKHIYSAIMLFESGGGIEIAATSERVYENNNMDIVSFISHELKTPINVIISAVQAMETIYGKEVPGKVNTYIRRIKQNVNKQLRLVNSMLDISKAELGYMQAYKKNTDIVKVTRTIVESVRLYAWHKGIEMKFNTLVGSKVIAMDEEKYERILLNILSNAIKYTSKEQKIYVNLHRTRDRICIEVRDEGLGIPSDKLKYIFERFRQVDNTLTRNSEGTGIGLFLVKQLVTVLGGEITVESEEGKGSSFKVYFPDEQINTMVSEKSEGELDDGRLERQVSIEFSDIYIDKQKPPKDGGQ